jgi:hypothetical protein
MVPVRNPRAPQGGMEARALLGLCDRYFLLTEIIGRSDMRWHGDPGEAVPAGNVWLYGRCREVEAQPDDRLDLWARPLQIDHHHLWRRHPGYPSRPGDHRRHILPHPPGREEVHAADQADLRRPRRALLAESRVRAAYGTEIR